MYGDTPFIKELAEGLGMTFAFSALATAFLAALAAPPAILLYLLNWAV